MLSILTGKNPDINRMVQEIAFELGYEWASGGSEVKYCNLLWRIRFFTLGDRDIICGDGIMPNKVDTSEQTIENTIDLRGIKYEH